MRKTRKYAEYVNQKRGRDGEMKHLEPGKMEWSVISEKDTVISGEKTAINLFAAHKKTLSGKMWSFSALCSLTILLSSVPWVNSVKECMSGHEVNCFECNSWLDPRCKDPFNYTISLEDMPPRVACEGCCVKLVTKAGTPLQGVLRTCTDKIDINLFMVDHVCMTEGGENGHMCFCEEDDCNQASLRTLSSIVIITLLGFLLL